MDEGDRGDYTKMMVGTISHRAVPGAAMLLAALYVTDAGAQLNDTVRADAQVNQAATTSQEGIDAQREAAEDAGVQYARYTLEADSLERYNTQLEEQVRSQEEELASIEEQLAGIETTTREIQPLMQTMVDTLRTFVALDIPFLIEERTTRVQNLVDLLGRADVAISEKYRRILEAYQIELEYGRTLEAYEGRLGDGDSARTVVFVRLGRIALMYRTEDGSEVGYWDRDQGTWIEAPEYVEEIEEALRVARQEGAPDLLTVPVPAPTPAFQESGQ
jgi:Protein of unknown function (DUF3450)